MEEGYEERKKEGKGRKNEKKELNAQLSPKAQQVELLLHRNFPTKTDLTSLQKKHTKPNRKKIPTRKGERLERKVGWKVM